MQRKNLAENHGLLIHYPAVMPVSIWMFNVQIDLSVAFLDENGRILQIEELKSYPERMDPARPVYTISDFNRYPKDDPILIFFQETKVRSQMPVKYALEMNAGWFRKNRIFVGDKLVFTTTKAYITSLRNSKRQQLE